MLNEVVLPFVFSGDLSYGVVSSFRTICISPFDKLCFTFYFTSPKIVLPLRFFFLDATMFTRYLLDVTRPLFSETVRDEYCVCMEKTEECFKHFDTMIIWLMSLSEFSCAGRVELLKHVFKISSIFPL